MPFDNFYKDSFYDQTVRRWAFFIVFAVGVFILFLLMPDEPKPRIITDYDRIKNVETLCTNLPQPEGFSFINKREPSKTPNSVSVEYIFQTIRTPEEIYPTYIIWLNDNGWKDDKISNKPVSFSKRNQTVSVKPYSAMDGFFVVTCGEKK